MPIGINFSQHAVWHPFFTACRLASTFHSRPIGYFSDILSFFSAPCRHHMRSSICFPFSTHPSRWSRCLATATSTAHRRAEPQSFHQTECGSMLSGHIIHRYMPLSRHGWPHFDAEASGSKPLWRHLLLRRTPSLSLVLPREFKLNSCHP